ncbi:MAG TPA: pyrimidine 5'-nucleotidase [Stellaceae bacterium]|nr:pyrimidine 5'-nucleotidase [Stellaceae bacterium]
MPSVPPAERSIPVKIPASAVPIIAAEIDTWIFDLDNTLYPASSNLFAQVSIRITQFIARYLAIELEEARRLQRRYFMEHGTTLRGLMTNHALDPAEFLAFVHDIDLTVLPPAAELDQALTDLKGRKLVFTNGSTRHAERILEHLGLARHFSGIFDIAAAGYLPKPDPSGYDLMIERFGITAGRAAMVEDMAKNLAPAALLGMTTVWVRTANDWAIDGSAEPHIHHTTDDLPGWLAAWTARSRDPNS